MGLVVERLQANEMPPEEGEEASDAGDDSAG